MRTMSYRQYIQAARRVNERMKDKRPQSALVRRVDGVRVDLIVGRSNVVIKNVEVIGDCSQVAPGDTVQIAWWDGDRPVAIVGADLSGLDGRMGVAEKRLAAINLVRPVSSPHISGGISDWQIIRFSNGSLSSVHEPDESGMQDALDVSRPGDNILLPTIQLAMSFDLPPGVIVTGISRFGSIILGTVRLAAGSALETLRVLCKLNSAETALAVQGPPDGQARINNCDLWAWNCGSGEAIGVLAEGGALYIQKSYLAGETRYGRGMATQVVSGKLQLEDCKLYSDTEPVGEVSVYGTLVGEMGSDCPSPISNSLLGYDEYQYNPNALYALPGGNTITEIPFRPWMHSKKYVYGVDGDGRINRLNLADDSRVTIATFVPFDERFQWTIADDDTAYIFNRPVNPGDSFRLRKVDFAHNQVSDAAAWELGDYQYSPNENRYHVIAYGQKLALFGYLIDPAANNRVKFFHRFYEMESGTLGALHVTDLTNSPLDENFTAGSAQLVGALYGSRLVVMVCPTNGEGEKPLAACIFDLDLETETLSQSCYQTDTSGYFTRFNIDDNCIVCPEGAFFKLANFSEGAFARYLRYDLAAKTFSLLAMGMDDPDDMLGFCDGSAFYSLEHYQDSYRLKDSRGTMLMELPAGGGELPSHGVQPAVVDGRLWMIVGERYVGYKIGSLADRLEMAVLHPGERYTDFLICEGYILQTSANQGLGTDKYYLVK